MSEDKEGAPATPEVNVSSEEWLALRDSILDGCGQYLTQDAEPEIVDPPVLYHMTDSETALKIATSSTLWASEASTTNDTSEIQYGRDLAFRHIRGLKNPQSFDISVARFIQRPDLIPQQDFSVRHFISCFCTATGLSRASTWLHYGRRGAGAAVGMRFPDPPNHFLLRKLDYVETSQIARIEGILNVGRELIAKDQGRTGGVTALFAHIVQVWLSSLAVRLKDGAFSEEDEWRIVYLEAAQSGEPIGDTVLKKDIRFGKFGQTIPYVKAEIPPPAICEIVLGHSSHASPDHIREQLPESLRKIPINRSRVPVRPT